MSRQNKTPAQNTKASAKPVDVPNVKASAPATHGAGKDVSREQIALRAYEIYQARGGQHGSHEADWHQAERELKLGRQ